MVPVLRSLLERAARELTRREADRARRAATSHEKLAEWAESFYARQEDYAVCALRDAVQLHSVLIGAPDETEARIRARVAVLIAASREALSALAVVPAEGLKLAVDALTARWEAERPAAF